MSRERKFKVPIVPSTTQKSIRFPNDIIENVEKAIQGTGCSFSQFVIAATQAALEDLAESEDEQGGACGKTPAPFV